MSRYINIMVLAALFMYSGIASALTDGEYKTVQKIADEFMSNVPADGYHILAEDVVKRIQAGDKSLVIVDVRMPKEKKFDQGHLPGAVYIPFKEIARPENLAKLPKDRDIVVHCDTGHEQNKVLAVLRMLGYKAYDMKWGMMAWQPLPPTAATLKAIEGSITGNYPIEK